MTMPDLDRMFERSAEAIARGDRSVADSLREWPDRADELAPLLEPIAIMAEAPALPDTTVDEQTFQALISQIRATPQDPPPRSWVPSLAPLRALAHSLRPVRTLAFPAAIAAVIMFALLLNVPGNRAEAATLEIFAGVVEQREAGGDWTAVPSGAELREGAAIRTTPGTRARIAFADGSSVEISGSAELTIDRHRAAGREIAMTQSRGTVEHTAEPRTGPDQTYAVATADATVVTNGGSFVTEVDLAGTLIEMINGQAIVRTGTTSTTLQASDRLRALQQAVIEEGQPTPPPDDGAAASARLVLPPQFETTITGADGSTTILSVNLGPVDVLPGVSLEALTSGLLTLKLSGDLEPGIYRLVLTRVAPGTAAVTLDINGQPTTVSLDASSDQVALEVEITAGLTGSTLSLLGASEPSRPVAPTTDGASPPPASTPIAPTPEPTSEHGGLLPPVTPPLSTIPGLVPTVLPQPTVVPGEAVPSGIRGDISIVTTCVPLLLASPCPPPPASVTLIVEDADGLQAASLAVANGSDFAIPLVEGDYRLRIAVDGQNLLSLPTIPFSITDGTWTQLDLSTAIAP